jgi:hypothetical protein
VTGKKSLVSLRLRSARLDHIDVQYIEMTPRSGPFNLYILLAFWSASPPLLLLPALLGLFPSYPEAGSSHGYDVQARVADNHHGSPIWLCCHCVRRKAHKSKAYVSSNTRNIEGHLAKAHNIFHPDPSKAKRYASGRTSNQPSLHEFAAKKRKKDDFHDELVVRFDKTKFQRLLVRWITDANLSFRVLYK